jgi:hypothetical protein
LAEEVVQAPTVHQAVLAEALVIKVLLVVLAQLVKVMLEVMAD